MTFYSRCTLLNRWILQIHIQAISKIRRHFKKVSYTSSIFFCPFSYKKSYCLSIFRPVLSRIKSLVEINIFQPKGSNLCRVCFCTFPPYGESNPAVVQEKPPEFYPKR